MVILQDKHSIPKQYSQALVVLECQWPLASEKMYVWDEDIWGFTVNFVGPEVNTSSHPPASLVQIDG